MTIQQNIRFERSVIRKYGKVRYNAACKSVIAGSSAMDLVTDLGFSATDAHSLIKYIHSNFTLINYGISKTNAVHIAGVVSDIFFENTKNQNHTFHRVIETKDQT